MRLMQIGSGSMGKRRIRCLKANGENDILVVDPREDRRAEAASIYGVRPFETFESALDAQPEAAIVSVPGAHHLDYMFLAAEAGLDVFVEVPLATSSSRLPELRELVRTKKLILAPGCQLLFHPPTQNLRRWVRDEAFGKILHLTYTMGTYLPDWHTYEDIGEFYASDIELGGGNIDVIAQELIWLQWITGGEITAITARQGRRGTLPLSSGTPDHIEMILEMGTASLNLHFDVNDRTHETYLRVAGERQTAVWSKVAFGELRLFDPAAGAWQSAPPYSPENPEQQYVDEIAAWLSCLRNRATWPVSLDRAISVVRVLEELRVSSRERRTVIIAPNSEQEHEIDAPRP